MTEYINRQEFLDIISERNRDTCNGKLSCLQMKRMVEGIPAADVTPVRHGRWVTEVERTGNYAHCSMCDCRCRGYTPHYKYCPNCGARMDGVADDGE